MNEWTRLYRSYRVASAAARLWGMYKLPDRVRKTRGLPKRTEAEMAAVHARGSELLLELAFGVASASLAQVHEARLLDGRQVAVKVQYPGIESIVRTDLANMRRACRIYEWLDPQPTPLAPLLEELATHIGYELDFQREANSAERVKNLFANNPRFRVPAIYRSHSTSRVLTMEWSHNGRFEGEFTEEMTGELFDAIREDSVVSVPTDFVLVGRVFALLSGIAHTLGHRANILQAMGGGAPG